MDSKRSKTFSDRVTGSQRKKSVVAATSGLFAPPATINEEKEYGQELALIKELGSDVDDEMAFQYLKYVVVVCCRGDVTLA
jgi:hypothetical protein